MILLYTKQDSLVFAGAYILKSKIEQNEYISKNTLPVSIKINEDLLLHGSKTVNNSKNLIIYFGGNAENVTNFISMMECIKTTDIIGFNYRGFGKSEGYPSQEKLYSDALDIYDNYKDKYKNISIIGRSLGTAVASYTASKRDVDKLILITPFDSISNVAQDIYPFFPVKLLLKYPFDIQNLIKDINSSIYILMVKDDEVIQNKHTIALKKSINEIKVFKSITNSGHNDIMEDERLLEFIIKSLN